MARALNPHYTDLEQVHQLAQEDECWSVEDEVKHVSVSVCSVCSVCSAFERLSVDL